MEGQLSSLAQGQLRQEQKIDQLIEGFNTPRDINWAGWAAVGMGVLLAIFGGSSWVQQYTMLSMEPIKAEMRQQYSNINDLDDVAKGYARELGIAETARANNKDQLEFIHEWQRQQDLDIAQLQANAAESKKDRANLHSKVDDIDNYGSRKWVNMGNQ